MSMDNEKNVCTSEKTEEKRPNYIKSVTIGVLAGIINGLFGGGGGMIVVPMLIMLLKKPTKVAHATAIMIILPLSIVSGIIYALFGSFDVFEGVFTSIGVIFGGIVGAFLLKNLSSKKVVVIFSIVMLIAGVKMLFF